MPTLSCGRTEKRLDGPTGSADGGRAGDHAACVHDLGDLDDRTPLRAGRMDIEVPGHATSYAFAPSGFDQAAVLIIDSLGETARPPSAPPAPAPRGMSGTGSSRP